MRLDRGAHAAQRRARHPRHQREDHDERTAPHAGDPVAVAVPLPVDVFAP